MDKRKSYDIDDVIALAVKITVVLAAIGGAVYGLIKLNKYFRDRYVCTYCDFCDEDFDDDLDDCCCEECKEEKSEEETKESTEKESE